MNMDLQTIIEKAKERLKNRKPYSSHLVELERGLRELKTELYIKRDEANKLRKESDALNSELYSLRAALSNATKSSNENQINLNIMLKRCRGQDDELQEKREALLKIQLQNKMAVAEVETIKEELLKAETEKMENCRKIDVLEKKQRHQALYCDEILRRDNCLRSFVDELNDKVGKLQAEHMQVMDLSKKSQLANETTDKLKYLRNENEKMKKEKDQFEKMYICVNAKYEKLEELLEEDERSSKQNLITEIVFNQWKMAMVRHDAQIKESDEILSKISESFNDERNANQRLMLENEKLHEKNLKLKEENVMLKGICEKNGDSIDELNRRIKELEEKLGKLECTSEEKVGVKDEPIEID